ncbi:TolB-like translocation protein [Microscilla marina]|uniref:Uncharacterized protein n=1 Tax=Microscilla marina ATCC 23134 TaxID=313606 RepID=A1ZNL4_MICM2|nr:PD40 domain-containing protein [Microscilla marina]EAY28125.1 hypothetical protein M23134_02235 [Microscilla marina ATCC 23134]
MKLNYSKYITATLIFTFAWQVAQAQFQVPKILKHPGKIKIKALHMLNSKYRETNLSISPDGKALFFMSGRGQQSWSTPRYTRYRGKWEHDGDIWYSRRVNGNWRYPTCLPRTVNSRSGEDEPNISPDGQTVYFQSWYGAWERKGGPYYKARLKGTRWSFPQGLGEGINQFFKERALKQRYKRGPNNYATDGATMSADGRTFIVAVGVYNGKMDLYISRRGRYGRWSYLRRLSVSTRGNERSPFLAADGKTLFFASDGYGGYGGLEILKTTINPDGSHGKVVNLGAPFNTYLDDYGFIMPASGQDAYFVRQGDIYYADVKNANPQIKPSVTLMISGIVTNASTKRGMSATITIKDARTKRVITTARSNSYTGKYVIMLPTSSPNFTQEVKKRNFSSFSKSFNPTLQNGLNEVVSNVPLSPGSPGVVSSGKRLLITGVVTNEKTKRGMQATIVIRDTKTNKIIKQVQSNPLTGLYKIKLPVSSPNFVQEVTQKDFDSFNKSFSPVIKTGLNRVVSNVPLTPKEVVVAKQLMIAGIVTNASTQKGMSATVTIKDSNTGTVIAQTQSKINGQYKIKLPADKPSFVQVVTKNKFSKFDKSFSEVLKPGMNKVVSNVALRPVVIVVTKKIDQEAAAETGRK